MRISISTIICMTSSRKPVGQLNPRRVPCHLPDLAKDPVHTVSISPPPSVFFDTDIPVQITQSHTTIERASLIASRSPTSWIPTSQSWHRAKQDSPVFSPRRRQTIRGTSIGFPRIYTLNWRRQSFAHS